MSGVEDRARLLDDAAGRLEEVARRGGILQVARDASRPDVALLTFRGKGLAPSLTPGEKFVEGNEWRCELRFPFRYPERPPEIRWRTEIYHPNVPLSGWMSMDDLGMTWSPDAPLDSLCERLWDLIRYAHVDLDQIANFSAREWYASQSPGRFPLDDRTLSIAAKRKHDNVIHYYRRAAQSPGQRAVRTIEPAAPPARRDDATQPIEPEVTFLGEVSRPQRPAPRPIVPVGGAERTDSSADAVERTRDEAGRIYEIGEPETGDGGPRVETESSPSSRSRPALRPLPPPGPDEGIVFLE